MKPATALTIGEQSAGKPLRPFGSASVRKVVAEARARADRDDLELRRPLSEISR